MKVNIIASIDVILMFLSITHQTFVLIRPDQGVLKISFVFIFRRRLQDALKTSSRRLSQDQYIRLGHMSSRRLQDVFKRSSRRFQDIFKTSAKLSSRHLQDVFKTSSKRLKKSSRRLQNVFKASCKNVFKTSSRCFQGILKASSRHLQVVLQRYIEDVFKTYHQVKLLLLMFIHKWDLHTEFNLGFPELNSGYFLREVTTRDVLK